MSTAAAKFAEQNKTCVRRVFEEIYNQGKLSVADELYANNAVRHDAATPDVPRGPASAKEVATRYRTAFPDLHLAIEDMISEGDKVATRWSAKGTHQGDLQGVSPTGKTFSITGMYLARLTDGKIVEDWSNWDTLGMMKQLGVITE
jgi:steroid delta-isomerase-like uncharacterized protein